MGTSGIRNLGRAALGDPWDAQKAHWLLRPQCFWPDGKGFGGLETLLAVNAPDSGPFALVLEADDTPERALGEPRASTKCQVNGPGEMTSHLWRRKFQMGLYVFDTLLTSGTQSLEAPGTRTLAAQSSDCVLETASDGARGSTSSSQKGCCFAPVVMTLSPFPTRLFLDSWRRFV